MPMALMEAMAAKIPVICSDIRGNRELVPEKELRFNPKNPEEIAACICRAERENMAEITMRHYRDIRGYRLERVERIMRKEYGMVATAHMPEIAGK